MASKYSAALLVLLTSYFVPSTARAKVPAIIVFEDSFADAGNNNFIPPISSSNFEPYVRDFYGGKAIGRFSNGRIPTDFIFDAFKIKPSIPAYLDPAYNFSDFATRVTFASVGTGYDTATSYVLVNRPNRQSVAVVASEVINQVGSVDMVLMMNHREALSSVKQKLYLAL